MGQHLFLSCPGKGISESLASSSWKHADKHILHRSGRWVSSSTRTTSSDLDPTSQLQSQHDTIRWAIFVRFRVTSAEGCVCRHTLACYQTLLPVLRRILFMNHRSDPQGHVGHPRFVFRFSAPDVVLPPIRIDVLSPAIALPHWNHLGPSDFDHVRSTVFPPPPTRIASPHIKLTFPALSNPTIKIRTSFSFPHDASELNDEYRRDRERPMVVVVLGGSLDDTEGRYRQKQKVTKTLHTLWDDGAAGTGLVIWFRARPAFCCMV